MSRVFKVDYIPDPDRGRPLWNAKIFVGVANQDPTIPSNQIQLTGDIGFPVGQSIPVPQPVRTNAGGITVYNNSPLDLNAPGQEYAIQIFDRNDNLIYNFPQVDGSVVMNTTSQEEVTGLIVHPDVGIATPGQTVDAGVTAFRAVLNGSSRLFTTDRPVVNSGLLNSIVINQEYGTGTADVDGDIYQLRDYTTQTQEEITGVDFVNVTQGQVDSGFDLFPLIGQGIRVAGVGLWVVPSVTADGSPMPNPALLDTTPSGPNVTINGGDQVTLQTQSTVTFLTLNDAAGATLSTGQIVTVAKTLNTSPVTNLSYIVEDTGVNSLPQVQTANAKFLTPIGAVYAEHFGAGGSIDSGPALIEYINYMISLNGYGGTDGDDYIVQDVKSATGKQFLIGSEVHIRNDACRGLRISLKCAAVAPLDDTSQLFRFESGAGGDNKVRDVLFEDSHLECMRLSNGILWESASTKGMVNSTCKGFVFFGCRSNGFGVENIYRGNEFAEFRFGEPGYDDRPNMQATALDTDDQSSGGSTDNKIFENIILYTNVGIEGNAQNNLVSQNHIYGGNIAINAQSALWQITNNQFDSVTVVIGTERVKILNNTWNHSASRTDDIDAIVITPTVNNAFLQGVVIKNNNFDNRSATATMDAVALDTTNGSINNQQINDSFITENYYSGTQVKKYRTEFQRSSFAAGVNTQTVDFNDYLPDWVAIRSVQWSWTINSAAKNIFLNVESIANREVQIDYYDTANAPVNASVNLFVRVDCYNPDV